MSTIFDVTSFTVEGGSAVNVAQSTSTITLTAAFAEQAVTITPYVGPEIVQVQTPGPQGPPGLQNVYVQSNDPAVQYGWGPGQTNYVWIQV